MKDLKELFKVSEIIIVDNRGIRVRYHLDNMVEAEQEGIKSVTELSTEIKGLLGKGPLQLSFFDKKLIEVEEADKQYIVCINPVLAKRKQENRARNKMKFEAVLADVQRAYQKQKDRSHGKRPAARNKNFKLSMQVKDINAWRYKIRKAQEKYNMQNVYKVTITRKSFCINYDAAYYESLGKYDGIYILVKPIDKKILHSKEIQKIYKKLQLIDHVFQDIKSDKINTHGQLITKERNKHMAYRVCIYFMYHNSM
jgi:hypothetical protein